MRLWQIALSPWIELWVKIQSILSQKESIILYGDVQKDNIKTNFANKVK